MRIFTSGLSLLSSRKGIWTLGKWGRVITRPGCWTVRDLFCAISGPHANAATTIVKLIFLIVWFITLVVNLSFGCCLFGVREDFFFRPILIDLKTKCQVEKLRKYCNVKISGILKTSSHG